MNPQDEEQHVPAPEEFDPLVVTPEQYEEGYVELGDGLIVKRRYKLIRTLPDGNYVVQVPTITRPPDDDGRLPVVDAR